MGTLSRTQKIILLVLAVLDFAVIGGLAAIVITSSLRPAQAPPSHTPVLTTGPAATWTPTPAGPTETPRPTLPARPTNTPRPTSTPVPTATPTNTPTPRPPEPITLNGADFDFIMPNRIPGWKWDAYVNYKGDSEYDAENSYAEPLFLAADDPVREINGSTLKVETIRWLKFRTWVHQTVTVTAGSRATFQIKAQAFSSLDRLIVKAGIDPTGAEHCYDAIWGEERRINQDDGTVLLTSPQVIVQPVEPTEPEDTTEDEGTAEATETPPAELAQGEVTLCFFAEPTYPHINNAAFFDQAELIVSQPR